jgi:hypothetical protein
LFSKTGFSQETKAEFTNIDFFLVGEKIQVTYDLVKSKSTESFEVKLVFKVDNSELIIPNALDGDVGTGIKGGKGKVIYWDVFRDVDGIEGDIIPHLEIVNVDRTYGGPTNALLSVPIPGLGDYYVANHKEMMFKPYIKTALAYGLVGVGVMQMMSAQKSYDDYLASTDPTEWNDLYDKANSAQTPAAVLIGAGAAIWLYDIVWVAVKGSKNMKENQYNFSGKIDQKLLLGYDQYGPNLKFVLKPKNFSKYNLF